MEPDNLQSLVAYIADRVQPGKVKLFKLMYLADFMATAALGHSISGDVYENWPMGPVPRTLWKNFNRITSECVTVTEVPTTAGMLNEQQLSGRSDFIPRLSVEEKAIIDDVLTRFGNWSGTRLKEYTHRTLPYRATPSGETIPYGLAGYLDYRKPTQQDVADILRDDSLMADLREALRRRTA